MGDGSRVAAAAFWPVSVPALPPRTPPVPLPLFVPPRGGLLRSSVPLAPPVLPVVLSSEASVPTSLSVRLNVVVLQASAVVMAATTAMQRPNYRISIDRDNTTPRLRSLARPRCCCGFFYRASIFVAGARVRTGALWGGPATCRCLASVRRNALGTRGADSLREKAQSKVMTLRILAPAWINSNARLMS